MKKLEEIYKKHYELHFNSIYVPNNLNRNFIADAMREYTEWCLTEYISDLKNKAKFQIDITNDIELKNAILQK